MSSIGSNQMNVPRLQMKSAYIVQFNMSLYELIKSQYDEYEFGSYFWGIRFSRGQMHVGAYFESRGT